MARRERMGRLDEERKIQELAPKQRTTMPQDERLENKTDKASTT